jgi:hypothetical protein
MCYRIFRVCLQTMHGANVTSRGRTSSSSARVEGGKLPQRWAKLTSNSTWKALSNFHARWGFPGISAASGGDCLTTSRSSRFHSGPLLGRGLQIWRGLLTSTRSRQSSRSTRLRSSNQRRCISPCRSPHSVHRLDASTQRIKIATGSKLPISLAPNMDSRRPLPLSLARSMSTRALLRL